MSTACNKNLMVASVLLTDTRTGIAKKR